MWFEVLSSLRINMEKSIILPVERVEDFYLIGFEAWLQGKSASFFLFGAPFGCTTRIWVVELREEVGKRP